MSRTRHTEAEIIAVLKQVEAGRKAEDVAREAGVSKHTIYAWKAKYGGMDVSEAEEVKHLREENARLKKLVADLSLDKDMLQSVIRKHSLGSESEARKCHAYRGVSCERAPLLRAEGDSANDLSIPEPAR